MTEEDIQDSLRLIERRAARFKAESMEPFRELFRRTRVHGERNQADGDPESQEILSDKERFLECLSVLYSLAFPSTKSDLTAILNSLTNECDESYQIEGVDLIDTSTGERLDVNNYLCEDLDEEGEALKNFFEGLLDEDDDLYEREPEQ
jgi:hypothetical protein